MAALAIGFSDFQMSIFKNWSEKLLCYNVLHTPSTAFRHLLSDLITPLKGYSISGQLSTDAVSALRKVGVLTRLENIAPKHARKQEARPPYIKNVKNPSIQIRLLKNSVS